VVEPGRTLSTAGVAVVAAGPIAADPSADLVAQVAAALAQLAPERGDLPCGRVKRPVVVGQPVFDGVAQGRSVVARERGPATPDRRELVRVAVPDAGEAMLVGEPDDAPVPRLAEAGRVERLQRIGVGGGIRVVEQPAEHPALCAQRIGHERMGRDRQAAGLMDGQDGRPERPVRSDGPLEVQGEQVAAERGHLLADDDLDAQATVPGERLRGDRRVDPLVIGDGDDIEVRRVLDVLQDLLDAGRPVAGDRVDVQVGPATRAGTAWVGHAAAPGARVSATGWPSPGSTPAAAVVFSGSIASASRSGQIGKNTAHHWSGASAMSVSNAAAMRVMVAVTRSRRLPSVGTSIGIT
jgi:hypothetical protein